MTDKPIIFSAPMVQALLDGRKTQTRRALKPPKNPWPNMETKWLAHQFMHDLPRPSVLYWTDDNLTADEQRLPYCRGDRLWGREAHYVWNAGHTGRGDARVSYRATEPDAPCSWTSPIHMPRWASRLTLTVTDVRVQRVQEISEADAVAEGVDLERYVPVSDSAGVHSCGEAEATDPREEFHYLWDSINAKRGFGWDANPWVAAYTFTVERNKHAT